MLTSQGERLFLPDPNLVKCKDYLVQRNKLQWKKVLLSGFYLNSHTLGCHPQTQKIRTALYSIINSTTGKHFP